MAAHLALDEARLIVCVEIVHFADSLCHARHGNTGITFAAPRHVQKRMHDAPRLWVYCRSRPYNNLSRRCMPMRRHQRQRGNCHGTLRRRAAVQLRSRVVGELRFIPLVVRFNLDRFGLRITLDQWQMLPYDDRELLARFPVEDDREIEPNFDHASMKCCALSANVEPEKFTPERTRSGARRRRARDACIRQSRLAGVSSPSCRAVGGTRAVSTLCARETRAQDGELNHDFVPAMREFGLAD